MVINTKKSKSFGMANFHGKKSTLLFKPIAQLKKKTISSLKVYQYTLTGKEWVITNSSKEILPNAFLQKYSPLTFFNPRHLLATKINLITLNFVL